MSTRIKKKNKHAIKVANNKSPKVDTNNYGLDDNGKPVCIDYDYIFSKRIKRKMRLR